MKDISISKLLYENDRLRSENTKLREWLKILSDSLEKLDSSEYASNALKMMVFSGIPKDLMKKIQQEIE